MCSPTGHKSHDYWYIFSHDVEHMAANEHTYIIYQYNSRVICNWSDSYCVHRTVQNQSWFFRLSFLTNRRRYNSWPHWGLVFICACVNPQLMCDVTAEVWWIAFQEQKKVGLTAERPAGRKKRHIEVGTPPKNIKKSVNWMMEVLDGMSSSFHGLANIVFKRYSQS